MKERPILFSGPMVRAILDGRKTQTRRVVEMPDRLEWRDPVMCKVTKGLPSRLLNRFGVMFQAAPHRWIQSDKPFSEFAPCPYGQPGDRLWVRETWAHVPANGYRRSDGVFQTVNPNYKDMAAVYAAEFDVYSPGRWRPSVHMPRWASRITLEITAVRVERVQEISQYDAMAEGVNAINTGDYVTPFAELWDSINAKRGCGWEANPWVWVVEFRRVEANQ